MSWDRSGSLFALGARFTYLDLAGAPLIGDRSSYTTDALVGIGVGLEYEDGQEITQRSGAGAVCLGFKAPDTLKRGTVTDFQVCMPDPNVMKFAIGGEIITRAPLAEVQTATITGAPTGGTVVYTYAGDSTGPVAYDAAAADVQAALLDLDAFEVGDLTVTGAAGGPYTITFSPDFGNPEQFTASGAGLTGGTNPGVTVATTTQGRELTDIGYRAPEVGQPTSVTGIGLEFWTAAIQDGAYTADLPYIHWLLPRTFLKMSDAWKADGENPMLPGFEGYANQNKNWGNGPANDWPYGSDRVWQWARVAELPDLTPGYRPVTA